MMTFGLCHYYLYHLDMSSSFENSAILRIIESMVIFSYTTISLCSDFAQHQKVAAAHLDFCY